MTQVNIFEDETLEFFALLKKYEVRYMLVGGFAVNYHGFSRTTGDVDLWLDDSEQNKIKLVNALKSYGIKGAEGLLKQPLIAGFSEVLLDNGVYLDLMSSLQFFGQNQFEDCFEKSASFTTENNIEVRIIHVNHLIEEKKKSSRPQDLQDAIELEKILNKINS